MNVAGAATSRRLGWLLSGLWQETRQDAKLRSLIQLEGVSHC